MKDNLIKIAELYWGDTEDKKLAVEWLTHLVGKDCAEANIFIMELYKDMDDDNNIIIDKGTYAKMKFRALRANFGKSYYYDVEFNWAFKGNGILISKEYSRHSVGAGYPKDYLLEMVCGHIRRAGIKLCSELFMFANKETL